MKIIKLLTAALLTSFVLVGCSTNGVEKFPLHSINLNGEKSSNGTFFLIYGSYESKTEMVYTFYAEDAEGIIQLYRIPAEDMRIKLENVDPYIECDRNWGNQHDVRSYDEVNAWGDRHNCTFHLPENSIGGEVDIKVK